MQKCNIEIVTAHNGAEVIILRKTEYIHTKLDDIRSDWREQERKRREINNKSKIIDLFDKIKNWCA
jgi:hypothetical protein